MDIKRTSVSAETMTNYIPRVLGSMMLRPGLGYLGSTLNNDQAKFLPFVFSTDDTALIEITDGALRVWEDDELVTRPSVTSAITNPFFTTDLAGWTASGGVTWVAGAAQFVGNGTTDETLDQTVTVAGGNIGVLHSLRIEIQRGPIKIRVGTAAGDDNYVEETTLDTGTHSLAFTPTGNFTIRFMSPLLRIVLLASCDIGAAGVLQLPAPWLEDDLYNIRYDQSGDVLFIACATNSAGSNYMQRKIERRANSSWSIVRYFTTNGPYRVENVSPTTLTASGTSGNITVTASAPTFAADQEFGLYSITNNGQYVVAAISAANTFTDPIEVIGVDEQRRFSTVITGTFTATVTVQYSIGVVGNWVDSTTFTAPTSQSDKDALDNQTVFYRIGIKTGDYALGTATVSLDYPLGAITGVVRITSVTNSTVINAEVIKNLGNLEATDIWAEGSWSDRRGWPTAVSFYEGRLWWAGQNGIYGSVSDAFNDFDPETEGSSGPINRTIGSGPVDDINWLLPLQRLIIGAEGTEFSARSTAFDEPLTPTNFNIKGATTQGSANVMPVKVDSRGAFVQRSLSRVYELSYSGESNDYALTDMTAIVPEVGRPSVLTMAVQRQPDTRIHCVRSDGIVAVAVTDRVENVLSWQLMETEGVVEDVVVLPGADEDAVYYSVARTIPDAVLSYQVVNGGSFVLFPTPTITVNAVDGGSGATASYTMTALSFSSNFTGSGYVVGDIVTIGGGVFTTPATFDVREVGGAGYIVSATVVNGGDYSDGAGVGASFTGGSGTGATAGFVRWSFLEISPLSYGSGYANGATVSTDASSGGIQINATTGTATGRHLNRWAKESECQGGTQNLQADSYIKYSGDHVYVIPGLEHLEGKEVIVWADGIDYSPDVDGVQTTYLVTDGTITLAVPVSEAVVGLPYTAEWMSTKLAWATDAAGSWLNQRKKVSQLGFIMANTHSHGVKYGPDFDSLDDLPGIEQADEVPYNTVWDQYDFDMMEFAGEFNTDSRVCLQSKAPRPCTVLALTMALEEHGKS
jgi:hypothetical protein